MNIITQINPHPDGVRCGECRGTEPADTSDNKRNCRWSVDSKMDRRGMVECLRGPACLAAEQKLKRLVGLLQEASERLDELFPGSSNLGERIRAVLEEEEQ